MSNSQTYNQNMDPSKIWIRNTGPGSMRKYPPRHHYNRNHRKPIEPTQSMQNTITVRPATEKVCNTAELNPHRSSQDEISDSVIFQKPKNPKGPASDKRASNMLTLGETNKSVGTQQSNQFIKNRNTEEWSSSMFAIDNKSRSNVFQKRDDTEKNLVIDISDTTLYESCRDDSVGNYTKFEISGIKPLEITPTVQLDETVDKTLVGPIETSTTFTLPELSPVLSDISDDDAIAESTVIEHNSTEGHNTCVRIEKAASDLWNLNIGNKAKKTHEIDTDLTLVPTYLQFTAEKIKKTPRLHTKPNIMPLAKEMLPSTSTDEFIQVVYMRETTVNRLIKSGYISFVQGKLHYIEQDTDDI
ncbi:uncharacterized protein LOC116349712 [Contarinia nasturtii]|uniref:uncharacterized protein LOC116349712 n=1 Tax=Contarinia nasturtii TaxID=265458 RepID=UPI0012D49407|nr:uncharacterized protein LOC116349712 [Contarinia nasturtii]XP_031637124.1 uncharacterized protein LOC116349712 [Contarinia nasturtii]XP_031637125.1 uncharacterized protein LOC116349712 [Contarinia nasturtii]XP_031637126.1 uncharacterized protein LOC116349712 [Contarinia nasturtii]XP_031637127.1 uncharacterized protein LOC116349712 [Contarinia nasturtii]